MERIRAWLRARFEGGALLELAARDLVRPVPRFVNGWYAMGTAMLAYLALQFLTGLLLALYYVPTPAGAAASVEAITRTVGLGWFVRSMHHWGATLLVVLAALHMLKALVTGAYKAPRETTWAAGGLLLALLLAFGLTGYLLPWDQVAYWGTTVVTDSFGALPLVGPLLLEVLRGGPAVGDVTLLRFYVLHILLLPAGLLTLLGLHLLLVRHFGTAPAGHSSEKQGPRVPEEGLDRGRPFWPIQVLQELPLVYLLIGVGVTLAVLYPPGVGTPADPFSTPSGIRPEWYFLPNYQLFKYLPTWLGLFLTGLGGLSVLLLPWWDTGPLRWLPRRPIARWTVVGAAGGVLLLGILGALSETSWRVGGTQVEFDIRAVPSLRPVDAATRAMLGLRALPSDSLQVRAAALLDERCAGCHGGPSPLMELNLEPGDFAASTIGIPSRQTGIPIVVPGDPDGSYLIKKVTGAQEAAGARMPLVGAPVEGEELALLRAWIEKAAPSAPSDGTGDPRMGILIVVWAILALGGYAAWLKRRQLTREGT